MYRRSFNRHQSNFLQEKVHKFTRTLLFSTAIFKILHISTKLIFQNYVIQQISKFSFELRLFHSKIVVFFLKEIFQNLNIYIF